MPPSYLSPCSLTSLVSMDPLASLPSPLSLPPQASDSSGSAATVPSRQPSTTLSTQSMLPTVSCPVPAPTAVSNLPCLASLDPAPFACRFPVFPSAAPSAQYATTTSIAFRPRRRQPRHRNCSTRSFRAPEAHPCRHPRARFSPEPCLHGRTLAAAIRAPPLQTTTEALVLTTLSLIDVDIMETPRDAPLLGYLTPPEPPLSAMDATHRASALAPLKHFLWPASTRTTPALSQSHCETPLE